MTYEVYAAKLPNAEFQWIGDVIADLIDMPFYEDCIAVFDDVVYVFMLSYDVLHGKELE